MCHGQFRVKASGASSPAHGQGPAEPTEFTNEKRTNQPETKSKSGILGAKNYQLEGPG